MITYVLGFMLSPDETSVVTILKKRGPKGLRGLFNAPGGQVEENESPLTAMVREFKEETSVETLKEDWTYFCRMSGQGLVEDNPMQPQWECHCFWTIASKIWECQTTTDEEISIKSILNIKHSEITQKQCVENFPYLLDMIDSQKRDKVAYYDVRYIR